MTAQFATTHWSQVLAAGKGSTDESRAALESLCNAYWYPLYAFVRRSGHGAEEASDLTQGFFEHLLESDMLRSADPERGRFRSYLLASLRNFMTHERSKEQALKRGGGATTISLDHNEAESRFGLEVAEEVTPDVLFERRWALTQMERALRSLAAEQEAGGHAERFARLRPYLTGSGQASHREVAEQLGMSESAVGVAIHRLRKRYGEYLRQEIADTVAGPEEIDDELEHLLRVVTDSPL